MQDRIIMQDRELQFSSPLVMAILNVTPDSFTDTEHLMDINSITAAAARALTQGADIIDIGGCSTRPSSGAVDEIEEMRRVRLGVIAVRTAFPNAIISVDTFRSKVAEEAVNCGADIINDISGGMLDPEMFTTVARLHTPYILTHTRMQHFAPQEPFLDGQIGAHAPFFEGHVLAEMPSTGDIIEDMLNFFRIRIEQLQQLGVTDIIIDPGYGFGKTLEQNYEILRRQAELLVLDKPLLAGVSHKSMIYKPLNVAPYDTQIGTAAINMMALHNGAHILRVHEVKDAKQLIKLHSLCQA